MGIDEETLETITIVVEQDHYFESMATHRVIGAWKDFHSDQQAFHPLS